MFSGFRRGFMGWVVTALMRLWLASRCLGCRSGLFAWRVVLTDGG